MLLRFDEFYIEPIKEEDYWLFCNFSVANEDRLETFFPKTLEQNLNPELSKHFAQKKAKRHQAKEELLFAVKSENDKPLVGLVYIKELDWEKGQGEFAYAISYEYEGKGITSKAISKLSEYAFNELGLKTLQIISHRSNISSIKVAEKNNFIWQKTLIGSYTPPNGDPMNMELYERYKKIS